LKRLLPFVGFLVFALTCQAPAQGAEVGASQNFPADSFCSGALQPPIEIGLEIAQIPDASSESGTAELTLSLTPMTESTRISWEIKAPSALSSLSGNLQGVESVAMGDKVEKTFLLSVPDGKRYQLYARAIVETKAGEIFTRAVSRYIDLGTPDVEHPSFVRTDPVRGNITSYRGVQLEGGAR